MKVTHSIILINILYLLQELMGAEQEQIGSQLTIEALTHMQLSAIWDCTVMTVCSLLVYE